MKSVNEATLIGNMTRDPEVRQTASGQSICTFGVATNHDWIDNTGNRQSEAEFHNVIAWAKLGEFIGQYFKKGDAVYVKGRIKTRSWVDEESGVKKFRTEIVARDVIQLRRINHPGGDNGKVTDANFISPVNNDDGATGSNGTNELPPVD